jgi:hypothetical protein
LPAKAASQPPHLSRPYLIYCGSQPAGDGVLTDDLLFANRVHIHSCGNGHLWFRSYSESLGRTERRPAPSNQGLLPLAFGASLWLGIPSLRSCSVGPPRWAIHGPARLTRHPCRVSRAGQNRNEASRWGKKIKSQIKSQSQSRSEARRGGLPAGLVLYAYGYLLTFTRFSYLRANLYLKQSS